MFTFFTQTRPQRKMSELKKEREKALRTWLFPALIEYSNHLICIRKIHQIFTFSKRPLVRTVNTSLCKSVQFRDFCVVLDKCPFAKKGVTEKQKYICPPWQLIINFLIIIFLLYSQLRFFALIQS